MVHSSLVNFYNNLRLMDILLFWLDNNTDQMWCICPIKELQFCSRFTKKILHSPQVQDQQMVCLYLVQEPILTFYSKKTWQCSSFQFCFPFTVCGVLATRALHSAPVQVWVLACLSCSRMYPTNHFCTLTNNNDYEEVEFDKEMSVSLWRQ